MLRHLKNANELVIYATISCGAAFIGRILPAFYFPILLLRLAIFGYCIYVIGFTEKNKELAVILGGALFIGMVGGYWDLIEVYLRYDLAKILNTITFVLLFLLFVSAMIIKVHHGKASKK
jgi:hypothetical protein